MLVRLPPSAKLPASSPGAEGPIVNTDYIRHVQVMAEESSGKWILRVTFDPIGPGEKPTQSIGKYYADEQEARAALDTLFARVRPVTIAESPV